MASLFVCSVRLALDGFDDESDDDSEEDEEMALETGPLSLPQVLFVVVID